MVGTLLQWAVPSLVMTAVMGWAVRGSVMLTGLPEFARLLLHNAARGSIDSETFNVLGATAAGNPPSVWR